jgi:hypothetical protein
VTPQGVTAPIPVSGALSELEVAVGRPLGRRPSALPSTAAGDPLRALEEALLPALRRPPCRIAFSGGRDSSLVLAAAVRAAERHGCAPPIAMTIRRPAEPEADEDDWQERVIDHLAVADWRLVSSDGDLDLLGPTGVSLMRQLGVYYPANAHALLPMLQEAGGSVVTGLGGDEVLSPPLWQRHNDVLARRRRPGRRDLARAAVALAPPPLRRPWVRRAGRQLDMPWLSPAARRRFLRSEAREDNMPVRYPAALAAEASRRAHAVAIATLRIMAAPAGVEVHTPLLEPGFVAALGAAGGRRGFGSRTAAMRAVAGELLPDVVLARRGKATFTGTFYGPASRAFARTWSGEGLPAGLVDPTRLRAAWLDGRGDFRAALLLQAAWLHDAGMAR